MKNLLHRLTLILAFLLSFALTPLASAAPKVVVSIAPLHDLVKRVMQNIATPTLLLPGNASPHDYALRPSDAQKLDQTDLVFWIGPALEGFLVKTLDAHKVKAYALLPAAAVKLEAREGGVWEAHDHDHHDDDDDDDHNKSHAARAHGHDHDHDHDDDHDDDEIDPHVWLDPVNAISLVSAIEERLIRLDPAHSGMYRTNAAELRRELTTLNERIAKQLASDRDSAFIVFHDAFQYFEHRYQLKAVGSITVTPEAKPSAQRMLALRQRLERDQVRCVFSEPQFNTGLTQSLTEKTGVRHGILDPLGHGDYFALIETLAKAMHSCLSAAPVNP